MVDRLLRFKRFTDSAVSSAFIDEIVTEQIPSDSSEDVEMKAGDQPTATVKTSEINRDFLYAARDAFQTGFRVRRNKPAEMIAKFIDRAMRRGQRDASDEEFSGLLDNVLGLYRFTQGQAISLLETHFGKTNITNQIRTSLGHSIIELWLNDCSCNEALLTISRRLF